MEWIYLWAEEEGIGHPITAKLPYTKELHEELAKAQEATEEGREISGELIEDAGDDATRPPGEYVFYEFLLDGEDQLKPGQ
jgi:hypothetical protein